MVSKYFHLIMIGLVLITMAISLFYYNGNTNTCRYDIKLKDGTIVKAASYMPKEAIISIRKCDGSHVGIPASNIEIIIGK